MPRSCQPLGPSGRRNATRWPSGPAEQTNHPHRSRYPDAPSQARRDFLRSRLTSATVGQWCRIFMSPGHGRRRSSAASLTPLRSTSCAGNRTCGSWPLEPALADVLKHSRAGRVPFEVGPQVRPELPRSSALLTLCLQRNAPLIAASALGLDERGQSTVRWRCSRCALASASQRTAAVSKPWSEADALVRWLVSLVAPISGRFLLNPRIPPDPPFTLLPKADDPYRLMAGDSVLASTPTAPFGKQATRKAGSTLPSPSCPGLVGLARTLAWSGVLYGEPAPVVTVHPTVLRFVLVERL